MESSSVSSDDKSPWPEQIGLGIRNRVSGLNFCFEKLDERLTQLMAKTEWLKDEAVAKASVLEISFLRLNLEDAKQRMDDILIENKDGGCKKEDGNHVIKKLKELIIEVFEIKCSIDLGLKVFTAIEGLEKGKGLIYEDADDVNYDDHYGDSSLTGTGIDGIDFAALGLSSSTEEESEKGVQEFLKKDGDVMERLLGKLALNSSSGDDLGDEAVSDSELFLATLTD
ncbi:hypothetical protein AB3S75_011907 [Citrus x aurantiifolia]